MCLSAQVSFAASVFLVGGGAAISIVAFQRNKRYLPLALMPLFAGLQQFTEGFVWVGMNGNDPLTVLCIRPVLARFQAFSACQFQGMSSSMRLIL